MGQLYRFPGDVFYGFNGLDLSNRVGAETSRRKLNTFLGQT